MGDEMTAEDPAGADAATPEGDTEPHAPTTPVPLAADDQPPPAQIAETQDSANHGDVNRGDANQGDANQGDLAEAAPLHGEPAAEDFADPDPDLASSERGPLTRRERWQRRSATGAILSGLALGFQQVFEAPKEDVSIIMETSGTPPRDLPVEAEFDEMVPRRSVVKIRPWLLPEAATRPDSTATSDDSAEGDGASETLAPTSALPETPTSATGTNGVDHSEEA